MANRRDKSINDINRSFKRIWHGSVEQSDVYKRLRASNPNSSDADKTFDFQLADRELRNGRNLSKRDQELNRRINKADKIATRYKSNLQKKGGFSDMSPYSTNSDRRASYNEYANKKMSYSARAGING